MKTLTLAATLGATLAMGTSAQATLIAYDSFHTTADPHVEGTYEVDRLMAQTPTAGLYGFTGPWSTAWNQTGDLRAQTGGLSHNLIGGATLDGHVYTTTGPAGRSIFRRLDYSASGVSATDEAEYYFSFAMSSSAGDRIAGMGLRGTEAWTSGSGTTMDSLSQIDNTDLVGISVGFENTDFAVWVNGIKTTIASNAATAGATYFSLVSIINNGAGNNDVVNVDIYNSNATLNDLGSPLASISVIDQDVTDKLWNISVQKGPAANSDGDGEVYFDEFRYGTSMDSVVVPEPASLALLGLGGLCLAARRRRN